MLRIVNGNEIHMTRGDTAKITVNIHDEINGTAYIMAADDTLTFTVKKTVHDRTYCFQKIFTGTNDISIDPSDTKNLRYGAYQYDIQLNKANGNVSTVIEPTTFMLLTEVTW